MHRDACATLCLTRVVGCKCHRVRGVPSRGAEGMGGAHVRGQLVLWRVWPSPHCSPQQGAVQRTAADGQPLRSNREDAGGPCSWLKQEQLCCTQHLHAQVHGMNVMHTSYGCHNNNRAFRGIHPPRCTPLRWQVMIEVESRKQRIAIDAEQSERLEQAGMLERCECVCSRLRPLAAGRQRWGAG